MQHYEINGNLEGEKYLDYNLFSKVIRQVRDYYVQEFGEELMNSIDLLIDNATEGSGHTPIITPVLGKYLIIKLEIKKDFLASRIVYQFSHELMHYVFFAIKGINKERAGIEEESICSAASLIMINELYPEDFSFNYEHVKNLRDEGYKKGAEVAESVEFDFKKLKELVYAKTGYQE
ncbi:MAG: hypothetical protein ACK5H4_03825 [Lacrimispora sphenoides]